MLRASCPQPTVVTSPKFVHTCEDNDTPRSVAAQYGADVRDVVFFNRPLLPGLSAGSRLMEGTAVYVPDPSDAQVVPTNPEVRYHVAADNETPTMIARRWSVDVKDLIAANVTRFKGMQPWSR